MGTAKFLGFVAKLGEGSHIIIDPIHPEMRSMTWNCYDSSAQDATLLTFNIIRRIPQRITVAVSCTNVSTVHSMIKFFVLDVLLRRVVAVSSDPAPDSAFAPSFFGRPSGQLP